MAKTYDVIIIGAGIMGLSSAFRLAQRGLEVLVLEKDHIGSGGTGRSSAIIRQHYSNEMTARMALHSLRVFQHFDDEVGGDPAFTQTGFLLLCPAGNHAALEANVALQRTVGINTQVVSPDVLKDLMPGIEIGDVVAAAYEPESGFADPHLTTNAFADAARRHGTEILVNTKVTGIRFAGDRVAGVETTREAFSAPAVVNCAGPWGAQVAAMAGLTIPVNPCRVQVTIFQRPATHRGPHPVVLDFVHATYLRSEIGDLSIAGLVDPAEADAIVDPDAYPEHMDPEFLEDMGARLLPRFPMLAESESRGGYASLYGITPDWHPIIDEVPAGSGHFLCTGFSGHGFKLGPAVGTIVADMVTRESRPAFAAGLFRLGRYAANDPVRGQYAYSIAG